ncbi:MULTISPECIES: hypothetical protein [unclassified Mesorhizobium]|uniref:hypothetical protein n=1 Tax=unclassified Mesorhizobium TaxID=325217 RepID=UPI0033350677
MHRFAVRTADFDGEGPCLAERVVAGDVRALENLDPRTALRMLTGAPVPWSFDAVVMQERCERIGDTVAIDERPRRGRHIRFAGEDVSAGTELVRRGKGLSAMDQTLLAAVGIVNVQVLRKIRIGLLFTGTELKEPGEPLEHGQIYNSNQIMLSSLLAACPWAEIVDFGMVPDSLGLLTDVFAPLRPVMPWLPQAGSRQAGKTD